MCEYSTSKFVHRACTCICHSVDNALQVGKNIVGTQFDTRQKTHMHSTDLGYKPYSLQAAVCRTAARVVELRQLIHSVHVRKLCASAQEKGYYRFSLPISADMPAPPWDFRARRLGRGSASVCSQLSMQHTLSEHFSRVLRVSRTWKSVESTSQE